MKIPLRYIIAIIGLVISFGILFLITFWLIYPYKILEVHNNPLPVSKTTVETGGSIYYHLDFCRFTDKPAKVTRQFIDGIVYTTQPITVVDTERCGGRDTHVEIPTTLAPDVYHMKVIVQIKVNPIRTITKAFETVDFEITSAREDDNDIQLQDNTDRINESEKDIIKLQ